VFIPCHHDQILGLGNTSLIPGGFVLPDMATEPLRLEIRNSMPETRAITPIYRAPIVVDMKSGKSRSADLSRGLMKERFLIEEDAARFIHDAEASSVLR